jgi:hypothetical protein
VIEVPRDRNGTFEPKIVSRHQRHFSGFDDKILSMYARGMTTREIQGHLQEIYGVEVSPSLISEVTDAVIEEVKSLLRVLAAISESRARLLARVHFPDRTAESRYRRRVRRGVRPNGRNVWRC